MISKNITYLVIFCLTIGIYACSSSSKIENPTPEQRFAEAKKQFEDGDYLDARTQFELIRIQFPGTSVASEAQFYIAECRLMKEEYLLAAYEYSEFLRFYPTHSKAPDARFKIAVAYYNLSPNWSLDQKNTLLAIEAFQTFIEYYPTNRLVPEAEAKIRELKNKLAKKNYESGVLYIKMEYYSAALRYFDDVLDKYYDSDYADASQLKKAEVQLTRKRYGEAQREINKFFERYPNSMLMDDAKSLQREIESRLGVQAQEKTSQEKSTTLDGQQKTSKPNE